MKDLLSFPGVQAEKKPEDKKPANERPPHKQGAAADSDEDAKLRELPVAYVDAAEDDLPRLQRVRLRFPTIHRFVNPDEQSKAKQPGLQRIRLRFPATHRFVDQNVEIPVDWYLEQDKPPVKDLGGFEGFKTYTREEAIPIFKHYIELDVKKLKEAKDDKSIREALEALEKSVQMLKELLSFGVPADEKP
jgi:hypothetical protein